MADFAVAMSGGQIKTGAVCRSERIAKHNRLLEIDREHQRADLQGGCRRSRECDAHERTAAVVMIGHEQRPVAYVLGLTCHTRPVPAVARGSGLDREGERALRLAGHD